MNQSKRLNNSMIVGLIAVLCCSLWGSAAPAIKTGYLLMGIDGNDVWTIILFAGWRFVIAGLMVIMFYSVRNRRLIVPGPGSRLNVLKLGMMQTVGQYVCNFNGVAHATSVNASILNSMGPLCAIICACVYFRDERMTVRKLIGCVLGFGGLLIMNYSKGVGGMSLRGEGLMLVGAVCGGISSCQLRVYTEKENAVTLTGYQFLFGGLVMVAAGSAFGGKLIIDSFGDIAVLVYLGFLSAVAYTLWNILIEHNGVSKVSIYGFATPLMGVLISALVMGEAAQALSLKTMIALAMVCLGIIAVNVRARSGNK